MAIFGEERARTDGQWCSIAYHSALGRGMLPYCHPACGKIQHGENCKSFSATNCRIMTSIRRSPANVLRAVLGIARMNGSHSISLDRLTDRKL
jgi:hypothetical protein